MVRVHPVSIPSAGQGVEPRLERRHATVVVGKQGWGGTPSAGAAEVYDLPAAGGGTVVEVASCNKEEAEVPDQVTGGITRDAVIAGGVGEGVAVVPGEALRGGLVEGEVVAVGEGLITESTYGVKSSWTLCYLYTFNAL